MAIKNYTISYQEFESLVELTEEQRILLGEALKATENAYAPYSKFHVGAALVDEQGKLFVGANMENAAYPLCICAEGSMLSAYSSSGAQSPISMIAITASSPHQELDHPVAPCGACRQMLTEFENKQGKSFSIILRGSSGPIYVINSVADILPLGFSSKDL